MIYKRWYLGRDGWWCYLCYDWCRPVLVSATWGTDDLHSDGVTSVR